jgi:multidrug efflux pump subunit AcrB
MKIVLLALRRPYTFVVAAVLILLLGIGAIRQTPKDIFPEIDIPVISVIWTYDGLAATEMQQRLTTFSEYSLASNVSNIRTVESQTLNGVGIIKIYFHPRVKIEVAQSQVTAVSQAILRRMPPGTTPPTILRFNASSVPIVQLALSSKTLTESQLYDYGIYRVRQQLATIPGITFPAPYGGRSRQIVVDIDPERLRAKGLSPKDVNDAISAQSLTLPTGTARIGTQEYPVAMNASPAAVDTFNDLPIKVVNGATVYMRDVAHVADGFDVQRNIVRRDGSRGVLLTILKGGGSSTLDIVDSVKALMPNLKAAAPPGTEIELLFDQSTFVRGALAGVVKESVIAALLTATMILLFLGSWRSTLIVVISIPLSILTSICVLALLGETLNVMTLGGLALAVGILVDDATVEIENIHRNRALGKSLRTAILDGAQQIAVPTFVATLTICIVFVSVFFLEGPSRYLFVPLAEAVVFAMMASYLLSRTLVPVMADFLLASEEHPHENAVSRKPGLFARVNHAVEAGFESVRGAYVRALEWSLSHRVALFIVFGIAVSSALLLMPRVGRDFFPNVDAGKFRLHVRAAPGLRIEETEVVFGQVEDEIRHVVPAAELALVLDNIGLVTEKFSLAFGDNQTTGSADGEILVALTPERSRPTQDYMRLLRTRLHERFPEVEFYFQSADIVGQILNFGLAAPIDVRVVGYDRVKNYETARRLRDRIAAVPGAVDVHIHQVVDVPGLKLELDRTRAAQFGVTTREVASDVLIALSGSTQVAPTFWIDPVTGSSYLVNARVSPYRISSLEDLGNTPVLAAGSDEPQMLSNMASIQRETVAAVASHADIQPVFDVYANVQDRDLGSVLTDVERIVDAERGSLSPANSIVQRGQADSMQSSFVRLGLGIAFAAILVYLLMVVNFQSWTDPFIIIMALPGAFVGIVWMLYVTQTTFSVPSLMGAIMSIGVATANSVLVVTFANEKRREGAGALQAAIAAGSTRLRPVIMTATAMIVGMLPMALGLGEGGEQNAPLGRAVIGGLLVATLATLFFVPVVYTLLRRKAPVSRDAEWAVIMKQRAARAELAT